MMCAVSVNLMIVIQFVSSNKVANDFLSLAQGRVVQGGGDDLQLGSRKDSIGSLWKS